MALKPYAVAQASLGQSLVNNEDPRQYGWTGDGCWMMHDILSTYEALPFSISQSPYRQSHTRAVGRFSLFIEV